MKIEKFKIIKIFQDSKDQSQELKKVQILKIKMIQLSFKFLEKILLINLENKDKMKKKVMELQCLQIQLGLAKIS